MAQTTEERIAQIAQGFGQGFQNYQNQQNMQRQQSLQAEALRRQQALQEMEIESNLSAQTGKNYIGSGAGKAVVSGSYNPANYDLGLTRKAELENAQAGRDAEDRVLKNELMRSSINKNNASAKKSMTSNNLSLTKGEEKVDADYAKDINDWVSTGRSSLNKNLQSLQEAKASLEKDGSLTGGLTGILPDRLTADRVLSQRQKVGSAVQGSLRATLGASFTEAEGNRTLANSYNEAAGAQVNKASLDKLINELQSQADINDQRALYFQKYGTLKGFNGITDSVKTKQAAPITKDHVKTVKSMSDEELLKFVQGK